ncbi:MAG: endolytic transglycosylase MltG [bacterium]|nr:endolytic transglycosylase MltG [bacterium]
MKNWLMIICAAVVILVMPPVAYFVSGPDKSGDAKVFVVEKGDGPRDIAAHLESAGLIRLRAAFVVYSFLSGAADQLKAGSYKLSPGLNVFKMVAALEEGPAEDVAIRVKEGETLADVEASLVKAGILKPKALSKFPGKSLEGFLFPDTYRFFPNSVAEAVVKKFFDNFYQQAAPVLKDSQHDFYDTLIIASILEKEVPFHDDRKLVAGLLYKRLKIGMALQVDAAPETYDHPGLPKKPIGNPGLDAIRAAANPLASEYLYYLSDPVTKKTIFSKTFDEHVANKFKYLR